MPMNQKGMDTLKSLMQLDIDAVHAYSQAIDKIDHARVREQLIAFRRDHERHIADLSDVIVRLGGDPPERARDFKGFLIEGFTALRSMTGTEGALKAMKGNEETTNKHYRDALELDFSPDVRAIVQRNYGDEKRHLAYVEDALADRVWEQAA
jgi:uncharacterized protein (TIGR02284 family)